MEARRISHVLQLVTFDQFKYNTMFLIPWICIAPEAVLPKLHEYASFIAMRSSLSVARALI